MDRPLLKPKREWTRGQRPPPSSCESILLVDDDEGIRLFIGSILQGKVEKIQECHEGLEAVRQFEDTLFDMVIMDLNMPGINGLEAVSRMRRSEGTRDAGCHPAFIVGLSSYSDDQTRQMALDAGFDLMLTKPVRGREIMSLLARFQRSARDFFSRETIKVDRDFRFILPAARKNWLLVLARMNVSLMQMDLETLKSQAHRLKGSLAMYGFTEAENLTTELENSIQEREPGKLSTLIESIQIKITGSRFEFE